MIRTQIQLTEEEARRVRALARREGVSMAEIVRRGVEALLADTDRDRDDAWAAAASVVGAFQDAHGAADVSERHDAYLDESLE